MRSPAGSARRPSIKEQALWTLQNLIPDSGLLNVGITFEVRGRVEHDLWAAQFRRLVTRHPALRTVYREMRGEPRAVVLEPADAPMDVPLTVGPRQQPGRLAVEFLNAPFDLARDLPVRSCVWRYPDRDVVSFAQHHIATDVHTLGLVFAELLDGYNAVASGQEQPAEHHARQASYHEPIPDQTSLVYWRQHVAGLDIDQQRMSLGRPDPELPTFAGSRERHRLSARTCAAITALAKRLHTTENIVFLAAYYLLLARHGAGPDLSVGVPINVRPPQERLAVGYHVNALPMRLAVDLGWTGADLVAATAEVFLNGVLHREVPFEAIMPDLRSTGANWRTPLFRYMFNYRPDPMPTRPHLNGLPIRALAVDHPYSRGDLEMIIEHGRDTATMIAVYSTELFDEPDVRALLERYETVLLGLAEAPERLLADIAWWSDWDHAVVDRTNDTFTSSPIPLVGTVISAQAADTPDAVAIIDGERQYSYAQLLSGAAAVRDRLHKAGVGPGDVVALHGRRGAALAAAVLGVWLADAAYLAVHPAHPGALVSFQLKDTNAAAVLADRPLPEGTETGCPVLPLVEPDGVVHELPTITPKPDARAYVVYTSGSTGRPKGIQPSHGNLANQIEHFRGAFGFTNADAALWLSTFAFEISALELLLPLSSGGRVVTATEEAQSEPRLVRDLVDTHDVGLIQATPTVWAGVAAVAGDVLAGRRVLTGGEPLPAAVADDLLASRARLYNVYGTTESGIWSTMAEITGPPDEPACIGVPISNTAVFVTDKSGQPQPPGVVGELCVAGKGVEAGYLNLPELTAGHFRHSPVYGRYFRTNDRARRRYDGSLELLGRYDRQVKVRGHRLELGELEAAFGSHPSVALAAATLRADLPKQSPLVVFVQPVDPAEPAGELTEALWRHGRERLPGYALPARLVLGRVPLNSNGKTDYQALTNVPLPQTHGNTADTAAGPMTEWLMDLWRDMLDFPELGPEDNFFLSGGHSIIAVRMLSQVRDMSGVSLSLTALLDAPTPIALARVVSGAQR